MRTDLDIIRQSQAHPPAFGELYDRHAERLTRFAIQRVGRDTADDVVSETFLVAYRKRHKFNEAYESAMPWLFGIAARVIYTHRDAERRHMRAIGTAQRVAAVDPDDDDADGRLDAARMARELVPTINKLAHGDRETLLLYAWGDLSYEQVAAALRIPVGTVRSRLNRVRRLLNEAATRNEARISERTMR